MGNKFFLTTAIPYVNGLPHVGHSLEYFQADTVRRYYQLKSYDTLLLSGADENALKNVQASEKEGLPIQQFLDINSKIWAETYEFLGVHLDIFQRGSDQKKHWPGVQKFWKLCQENGDIYKKEYAGLYCIGCESFKTNEELINGLCPTHQTKPELIKEENYFFKLSKYQDKLVQLIENNELKITPDNKRQEALSFIKSGLEDFSISRSNERAKGIGVPVPGDPDQKIYVWFDALNIYMTGIGFGWDDIKYQKWWPADLHIIGKDINRFHTVYWPAMLLSAGLPLPKQILIHGFVNLKGEKIIGLDSQEQEVFKYSQGFISNASGSSVISDLEWDNYHFSTVPGASLDLIATDPEVQPISLAPGTNLPISLYMKAETSLLLTIEDNLTLEPIFAARAKLSNSELGYDAILSTNESGQAYFIPLTTATYNLEIQAPGYLTTTTQVFVSGDQIEIIRLEQIE